MSEPKISQHVLEQVCGVPPSELAGLPYTAYDFFIFADRCAALLMGPA